MNSNYHELSGGGEETGTTTPPLSSSNGNRALLLREQDSLSPTLLIKNNHPGETNFFGVDEEVKETEYYYF